MVRESPRKCSHCGLNGHNSRTCTNFAKEVNNDNNYCVKLFGVNLMENRDDSMRKSFSMGNLNIHSSNHVFDLNNASAAAVAAVDDGGYLSDGFIHNKRRKASRDRKKGKAWTEKEHRTFLAGLKKLGKGDWRGISKKFVTTRTPTQVASHAQKYFLRKMMMINTTNDHRKIKKRRPSLFDIPAPAPEIKPQNNISLTSITTTTAGDQPSQILLSNYNTSQNHEQQVKNLPTQLMINRFPHLCLDTPQFAPPPTGSPPHSGVPNLHGIPYNNLVGVSPPNNGAIRASGGVMAMGKSSRSSSNNNNNNRISIISPIIIINNNTHPSGIPPSPQRAATSNLIDTDHNHALDLKIGLPQSPPNSKNLSNSGAIRVI